MEEFDKNFLDFDYILMRDEVVHLLFDKDKVYSLYEIKKIRKLLKLLLKLLKKGC